MNKRGALLLMSAAMIVTLGACSSGGGGGVLPPAGKVTAVKVTGTVDPNSVTMMAKATLFERFLANFSPVSTSYAVATPVDKIIAVSPGENSADFVEASRNGNDFSLDLDKGKSWVIAMLDGTNVVGIYKADAATDMDSLPISDAATNIDLGTVSLNAGTGEATGSINSNTLYQDLDITAEIAAAIGFMDDGMRRHTNVDVDGNGTLDYKEGKWLNLQIGYQLRPTENYAAINGVWSDKTNMVYAGYMFYVGSQPASTFVEDVWKTAKLRSPADITVADTTVHNDEPDCYYRDDRPDYDSIMLNFYCGSYGTQDPPPGDYQILFSQTTPDDTVFTYKNVKSQHIAATLNNVYFPEVKLTKDGNGKVTLIEWRWVKRLNDGINWTTPNAQELQAVLDEGFGGLMFELGDGGWNNRVEARGTFGANAGSVVPPAQAVVPAQFAASFSDKAGNAYHIEWNP